MRYGIYACHDAEHLQLVRRREVVLLSCLRDGVFIETSGEVPWAPRLCDEPSHRGELSMVAAVTDPVTGTGHDAEVSVGKHSLFADRVRDIPVGNSLFRNGHRHPY